MDFLNSIIVLCYFHVISVKLLWYNLYCEKRYINKCDLTWLNNVSKGSIILHLFNWTCDLNLKIRIVIWWHYFVARGVWDPDETDSFQDFSPTPHHLFTTHLKTPFSFGSSFVAKRDKWTILYLSLDSLFIMAKMHLPETICLKKCTK